MTDTARPKISKITGRPKLRRGFGAMDPEKRRAIAAKGGASVPAEKRSFARDQKLAMRAGAIGGAASRGGGREKARASQAKAKSQSVGE